MIELRDTTIDGKTVTDTLSIMTYEGSSSDSKSDKGWKRHNGSGWDWDFDLDGKTSETIISVTAIVFIFGLPLLIVFTVFFFNYKNRKAKYRLAEQALSSGQQLPEDFFKNAEKTEDIRTKGIKNIFIGIGLFIFLWAITENFGVGCVGLLIMFTGFGQLVIYYTQDSNKKEQPGEMSQLNDISLVAQVVVFRNTRAFDQLVGKYQSSVRHFFSAPDLWRQRIER